MSLRFISPINCRMRAKSASRFLFILFAFFSLPIASGRAASLEQMAGQMIMVGFDGNSVDAAGVRSVRGSAARGEIGGVMFLRKNVATLDAVSRMNVAFQSASEVPLLIALDQEGGYIERLTEKVGFKEIPSAQSVASRMSPQQAETIYTDLGNRLSKLGFNVNFGPVVDLNTNTNNPIIAKYERAFSADADAVVAYGSAFVKGHRAGGVLTALKHFPGHGSSTGDSHEGFVDVTDTWVEDELVPYRAMIASGLVDMVMAAHVFHSGYASDPSDQTPSSLSPNWINGVLRDQLGYDGVVISDDMQMGAIAEHYGFENAIRRAVMAGTDILLFSNFSETRDDIAGDALATLIETAKSDPAFAARIAQSYQRIMALKSRL